MELFRVTKNAWGQEILVGISWDLVWVFLAAAGLFVVLHALYQLTIAPDRHAGRD
jgi:formate dehydrogenase subunit gamma